MTNLEEKKRRLAQLAAACTDPSETESEASEEELDEYSLQTAAGKLLYESFTDEELLNVVRKTAERLGHSPAQREVFWVYRCYLKRRFEKWPYALQKAGLSKAAGRGGTSMARMEAERKHHRELLELVRERGIQLGRIPHPKDFQDELGDLAKYYQTWNQVLTAAGIHWEDTVHPIGDLEPEYRAMLEKLLEQARALGRAPLRSEVEEPLRKKLIARCGSWRNTLYQIGLEPVAHITPFSGTVLSNTNKGTKRHRTVLHECYYKVLNLDERAKRELEEVRRLAEKRGVILLTDPDGAGFVIRNHLKGILPPEQVKQAYVPDVYGKERRKKKGGKEGKLGVEGMPPQVLIEALRRAGATFEDGTEAPQRAGLTKADMLEKGLIGPASAEKRAALQRRLGLPEHLTANGLMEALDTLLTREEFDAL